MGAFVVRSVLRQPASPRPDGMALPLAWLGVAYGTADGLLLSVMPVAATWRGLSIPVGSRTRGGRIGAGTLAFGASLLLTAAYHLGYANFRAPTLVGPLVGCGVDFSSDRGVDSIISNDLVRDKTFQTN